MAKLLTGLVILLGSVSLSFAHHAFSSEFDANKPVTLTGTVTNVEWNAPHVYVYLDGKDDSGKTSSWKLEGANPDTLQKQGWKSTTLQKGVRITAMAYRSLDGSNTVSARSITLSNGRAMTICDAAEDGGPKADLGGQTSPSSTK